MKLSKKLIYYFRTITPQDYLFNQRESICAFIPRKASLTPLPNANQGDIDLIDEIQLIGLPRIPQLNKDLEQWKIDDVTMSLSAGVDLVFLQIDPSNYMARQRFMSHKCALGKVEDYRLDGVELIDPHKAITWQQTVVNLFTIDMILANALPQNTTYKNGLYGYSYPFIQDDSKIRNQITPIFIDAIGQHILGGKRTQFPMIQKFLYTGLMGRHKIMLGGMPQTLYKMILGKSLTIHETRDIFRTVILKNKELKYPFTIKEASQNLMPHIFLLPKDLYMTALLKQSFQAATQMVCAVGMEHYRPIQQYWIGPPSGINYTQATRIPDGFPGETTEDLIEKQAILDVLLQTRTWSKPYLSNPFPYLFTDIAKIDKKQLDSYKQKFLIQYKKYTQFKNRELKSLPSQPSPMLLQNQKKQEFQNLSKNFNDAPKLSHLKDKMNLKLGKDFFGKIN